MEQTIITLREVEERIERGDTPEAIREFLEEAARSGKMFDGELVRFICNGFDGENIDYFYQDFDDSSRWAVQFTVVRSAYRRSGWRRNGDFEYV